MRITAKMRMRVEPGNDVELTNHQGTGRVLSCEPTAEGYWQTVMEVPDEWRAKIEGHSPYVTVGEPGDGLE